MRAAKGDFHLAAEALGCQHQTLYLFVGRDQQLSALWLPNPDKAHTPDEADLMTRSVPPVTVARVEQANNNELAEAMMAQDREILRQGLQAVGIKSGTIKKLGLMENFAANTGRFLAASLDITHRVMVFQGVNLFERAEYIKETYLEDETLPHEIKIEWQKAYNELAEQIGKTSDRVLAGTQAAVAMMKRKEESENGGKQEKVVGFQPLKARQ